MNTQLTPPGMVRMASGQLLPASSPAGSQRPASQKFLIVLQYFQGDQAAAEELANLIADLERIRNHEADILIFARFDAPEFSRDVMRKLESKFDKVGFMRCRRKDARSYPFAPNQMFSDLITMLGQVNPWRNDYFAFINLESDCVPVHPGWIRELIDAYQQAALRGRSAVGFVHTDPLQHMNGVAVYATDIWRRVPGGKLTGCDPQVAYDICFADDLLPLCSNTPLIHLDFQRPTITADQLFQPQREGVEPALYHGVKDGSAREAVRQKYIMQGQGEQDLSSRTVFTFYSLAQNQSAAENSLVLNLWREGWRSRGWNPVVLSLRDAAKNPRYAKFAAKAGAFPCVGNKASNLNRFLRWLALDTMGGGLLTDFDVLPGLFSPKDHRIDASGMVCYANDGDSGLSALALNAVGSKRWLDEIEAYEAQPADTSAGLAHVSDLTIWRSSPDLNEQETHPLVELAGQGEWKKGALIHFCQSALDSGALRGQRKSMAMENYLRNA